MANMYVTFCKVNGSSGELKDLQSKINRILSNNEPIVETVGHEQMDNIWLGNLVHLLGGDYDAVATHGHFYCTEAELKDNVLSFEIEYAWREPREFLAFIEGCYKTLKVFYYCECGDYIVTNDREGLFFPERYYIIDDSNNEELYLTESLDDLLETICHDKGVRFETFEQADEYFENDEEYTVGKIIVN